MTNVQKQPNIYDVARSAGVSHQTVSRVINGHTSIRPETKERVITAMQDLGYRPNLAARALASSKTHMLGILSSDTDFTGPASMVHYMEVAARAQGYFAVSVGIDANSESSVLSGVEHLLKLGVEGLAVVTPQLHAVELVRNVATGIPVVTLDSMYRMDELAVSVDNFAGGSSATQFLIQLGHRNICHISGPKDWFESTARAAGYTSTMLNANLLPQVVEGDWEIGTGYRIGKELDLDSRGITAVFVANDRMALGLMHAMRERGISIPERLSVIGFDDLEESAYSAPPLTTLKQDFKELGLRAMKLLLDELDARPHKTPARLVPKLIIRGTTAPPAL
ncbi:MAG: LacI family DNA-binding transcriptional regulator [Actinomycetota bacterium]